MEGRREEGMALVAARRERGQQEIENALPGRRNAEVVHSLIRSIDLRYLERRRRREVEREDEISMLEDNVLQTLGNFRRR